MFPTLPTSVNQSNCFFLPIVVWDWIIHNSHRPNMTIGLIKGAVAIKYDNDYSKDSERLWILISMTVWAIWKLKLKNSINDQVVAPDETSGVLRGLITNLITKSWNMMWFLESNKRWLQQCDIQNLWAGERFATFDQKLNPTLDFSWWDVAGTTGRGGFSG